MHELLFGSWGPQIVAFTKQNPLPVISMVVIALSTAITLAIGMRGCGGDAGGGIYADGDSSGGDCGGD